MMTSNPEEHIERTPQPVTDVQWRRAHPAFAIVELGGTLRSLIFPAFIILGPRINDPTSRGFLAGLGILLGIVLISAILLFVQWRNYRYALTDTHLLVRHGLISKEERSIPYERIQAVNIQETPIYRLLGLARLKVETASGGTAQSEVDIRAITRTDAVAIREQLLQARAARRATGAQGAIGDTSATSDATIPTAGERVGDQEHPAELPPAADLEGELVRTLSMRELLLAGATSGTIAPTLALVGAAFGFADDIIPNSWWRLVSWDRFSELTGSVAAIAGLVGFLALVAWLLAIVGTVLNYYGFELRRTDDYLFVQHGLLDRRRRTIPVQRLQAIRMEEGVLRQPFGMATLKYDSAGNQQLGEEAGSSGMLVPLLRVDEVHELLERCAPEFAADVNATPLTPLPRRAITRYIVGDVLLALAAMGVVIATIVFFLSQGGEDWWRDYTIYVAAAVVVILLLIVIRGYWAWRDGGWWLDPRLMLLRTRGIGRQTVIASRRRVQHRSISANPLQRRANLATVRVSVAGGLLGGAYALEHLDLPSAELLLVELNPARRRPA